MRRFVSAIGIALALSAPLRAADALAEARRLYNLGQYEGAERLARDAVRLPALANAARVVLGRIQLERYRHTAASEDLGEARMSLRAVDPSGLDARERIELVIGYAETLYLEDLYGASAELFGLMLDPSSVLGPAAHERVLDWWATASDRQAQAERASGVIRSTAGAPDVYDRLMTRMASEIAREPGSTSAVYWLVAAARGAGDLDRAWNTAMAAWTLAPMMRDKGAALRADLDRLVLQAIIPERATRAPQRERAGAIAGMTAEWESFKRRWGPEPH